MGKGFYGCDFFGDRGNKAKKEKFSGVFVCFGVFIEKILEDSG